MLTLISGTVAAVSAVIFFWSLIPRTETAKVGEVYAHNNPGRSDDPSKPPTPFVSIYTVVEITDGKARAHVRSIDEDGTTIEHETWSPAYGLGKHDVKLKSAVTEDAK